MSAPNDPRTPAHSAHLTGDEITQKNRELVLDGDQVVGVTNAPGPKHTQGPWRIEGPRFNSANPLEMTGYDIYGPKDFRWVAAILGEHCGVPRHECEANARLLTAAPDLLAACQRVLAELEDGITMGCEEDLREAVAKAEGRE